MKYLNKIIILLLFVALFLSAMPLQTTSATSDLVPIPRIDGGNVVYRGTSIEVLAPATPVSSGAEFRAVWITPLTGDIAGFTSESQYKNQMLEVFEVMEYYNMNALIYHVRIMNDALYESDLNRWSIYYHTNPSWDAIPWIIEECHKRGIEFHAWMNPYRVTNSYSGTLSQYAATVPSYNIASNPENLLQEGNRIILNPGEPAVREFLVDTVMEFLERYNADAIHFDDYFYIQNVVDTHTRNKYNTNGLEIDDWRRLQIDLFIESLTNSIRLFNQENDRYVQLGISPSGIYRNGDGVITYDPSTGNAITNGSNTNGFAHYADYLYSDTKKWIDLEWIDYIIPQSYWAVEHPLAGFPDVMEWWVKIMKNKNVHLYSGMGLYLAAPTTANTYSWQNNSLEAYNQMLFLSQFEKNQGFSIFSYKHIQQAYNGSNSYLRSIMAPVRTHFWNSPAVLPTLGLYDPVHLDAVQDLSIQTNDTSRTLTWTGTPGAKYYAIYRSSEEVHFTDAELYKIIGAEDNQVVTYTDTESNIPYNYGIKPVSKTNTLGAGNVITAFGSTEFKTVTFIGVDDTVLKTQRVGVGSPAVPPQVPSIVGYTFTKWDTDYLDIQEDSTIQAVYERIAYNVTFRDYYNNIIEVQQVLHGDTANAPEPPAIIGLMFDGWGRSLDNVTSNFSVQAQYKTAIYTVVFKDFYGEVLETFEVPYGTNITPPAAPVVENHTFSKWSRTTTFVTSNWTIEPVYIADVVYYTVVFKDIDENILKTQEVIRGSGATAPTPPVIEGYTFTGWNTSFQNVQMNLNISPVYQKNPIFYTVNFYDFNDGLIQTISVEEGNDALAPSAPSVVGYDFVGWDQSVENVMSHLDVYSLYELKTYDIVFMDHLGNVFYETTVQHGETVVIDLNLIREGYTFKSWSSSLENITGPTTFFPVFERIPAEEKPPVTSCSLFNYWQAFTVLGTAAIFFFYRRKTR